MSKPDYSHAKKILTALEEGKLIEFSVGTGAWCKSPLNEGYIYGTRLSQLNDPTFYRVSKDQEYIPLEAEDIPATCWINNRPVTSNASIVTFTGEDFLLTNGIRVSYAVDVLKDNLHIATLKDFVTLDGAINRATVLYGGMGYSYEVFEVRTERELKTCGKL